jgi:hypothetical protein
MVVFIFDISIVVPMLFRTLSFQAKRMLALLESNQLGIVLETDKNVKLWATFDVVHSHF